MTQQKLAPRNQLSKLTREKLKQIERIMARTRGQLMDQRTHCTDRKVAQFSATCNSAQKGDRASLGLFGADKKARK
jgi:hypothetical protein